MRKSLQFLLMICILLLSAQFVRSEDNITQQENVSITINETINQTALTLKIEIVLPEPVLLGVTYDSLFKITNLNHTPGSESFAFVIVKYNVSKNNTLIKEDYFNKTINYYSSSNTGKLFLEETGAYVLCGAVIEQNLSVCKEFEVINPLTILCNITINLSTDKEIYLEKEQVKIKNSINNDSYPYIIEYWVEDLFGREVKNRQTTSNTNQKTYTPALDENDKVLLVKNRLEFVACNNSNVLLENEAMVIIRKSQPIVLQAEEKKSAKTTCPTTKTTTVKTAQAVKTTSGTVNSTKTSSTAKKTIEGITSFYNLNKKYNRSINLYANIKINETFGFYDLVLTWDKGEEKQAVNNSGKAKFNVEIEPGVNLFSLELRKQSKTIDSKSLKVELAMTENKTSNNLTKAIIKSNSSQKQNNTGNNNAGNKSKAITNSNLSKHENNIALRVGTGILTPNYSYNNSNLSLPLPVTGSVVYESSNAKLLKIAPYLVILVVALAVAGILLPKKNKNN
jgi:hypothetical protein